MSSRVSPPPKQNQKFSIPPQNGFSAGIFKSDFPLHRPLFQEFSFRIFAKSLDLTTSNYDERVRVLIYALFHHGWRKFWSFDVWNVKKMLWTIKNLPTSLPTRQKSENSNSSPKPFLSRLFEKRLPPRQNPLENPDFSLKFLGEMTLSYTTESKVELKEAIFMVTWRPLKKISVHNRRGCSFTI